MASRVCTRTLVLLLELLVAVVAFQCLAAVTPAQAGAVWLADDCVVTSPVSCRGTHSTIDP